MPITPDHARSVLARAECLHDSKVIAATFDRMANDIRAKLENANPLVLCLMTGGLIATSELLLRLDFPLEVDYLHATRYGDQTQGNALKWLVKPRKPLAGRAVLIIDDILDEGQTLAEIVKYCSEQGAKPVQTAVLVEKIHNRKFGLAKADYVGLTVPDRYVFGFGMDYKGYHRNVAGIYAAHKDDE